MIHIRSRAERFLNRHEAFFRFRLPASPCRKNNEARDVPAREDGGVSMDRWEGRGGGKGVTAKINQACSDAATFLVQLYQL